MASINAGTPEPGDGRPPDEPAPHRGLRDRPLGKVFLLALVLGAAFVVARTCGSAQQNVTKDEAIEIARENAAFEPCPEQQCVQIRFIQRGIPIQAYWAIILSEKLDAEGQPNRIESILVDVVSGEVSRP